jgi:proteic killer suppression protein
MILSFRDRGTEDIYHGRSTASARKNCPQRLWRVARRKLDHLDRATVLQDLSAPPGNRLERLTRERRRQHSIRINDRYRICFTWTADGPVDVEVIDYH